MNRRSAIKLIGAMGVGGVGTMAVTKPELVKSVTDEFDSLSDDSYPTSKEFSMSNNFVRAEWTIGPKITIETSSKGKMDGFGIFHEYGDTYEDALEFYEAPTHGGELFIDFKRLLDENEPPFPTRMFELWAYTGSFGFMSILDEKIESVKLGAPRSYVMPEYFQNETPQNP